MVGKIHKEQVHVFVASEDTAGVDISRADAATAHEVIAMKGGADGSAFDVQMCEMG